MNHLSRYISRLFLARLLVVTLAMVVLLGVLDALSNADLLPDNATMGDSLRYMLLRMPVLFDRVINFSLLLGIMLTYLALIRRNELVPIWGAGRSVVQQIRALIPVVLIAGALASIIADQTIPPAQKRLENWLGPAIVRQDSQEPERLWLSEANRLVEITEVGDQVLTGLTLFERGDAGRIKSVSHADTARLEPGGGWVLSGVSQTRYDGQPPNPPTLWTTRIGAATLQHLMAEPRNLSVASLLDIAHLERIGNRPSSAYRVWIYNRFLLPVVAVGFLILSLPLMQKFGRNDHAEVMLVVGMIIGFIYLITDGVFKSLAESGAMTAFTASAVPVLGLYALGLGLVLLKTLRI